MACIPLTPAQKAQLEADKESAQRRIDKYIADVPKRAALIAKRTLTDEGFKTGFDFYDGIVISYEKEREELDGTYIENPIIEDDINNPASLIPSRTTPENPVTDIIRITEFDGTPLITTDNEIPGVGTDIGSTQLNIEPYWITAQAEVEDWLQNGFGGTSPGVSGTMSVTEAITPSTTNINIESTALTETFNFQVGDRFLIDDGTDQVVVEVTNVVSQVDGDPAAGSCSGEDNPPQLTEAACLLDNGVWTPGAIDPSAELDIIVLTANSCGAGGALDSSWAGFSDTDRTNKVDATDGYDGLMGDLITLLELYANNRIAKLTAQETELTGNGDDDLDPDALTDVQTSKTFLTNYLATTIISDTGLTGLSNERATRDPQITARIVAIGLAFTGQPSGNYFDLRYTAANDRGNTSRGTLRILRFEESTNDVIADISASLQDKIDSIDDLLANACP